MTDLEFTVPDLVQGKEYLFKVCARNKCGPGEPAYVDEPVNMSAPASEYILDNSLPSLLLPVSVFRPGVEVMGWQYADFTVGLSKSDALFKMLQRYLTHQRMLNGEIEQPRASS